MLISCEPYEGKFLTNDMFSITSKQGKGRLTGVQMSCKLLLAHRISEQKNLNCSPQIVAVPQKIIESLYGALNGQCEVTFGT